MLKFAGTLGLVIVSLWPLHLLAQSQAGAPKLPWKGYAVLGTGGLTAVFSDDPRIAALTHGTGVQHLYFRDYTADYLTSTSFALAEATGAATTGMKNFFTAQTETRLAGHGSQTVLCFAHPDDAIVLKISARGLSASTLYHFQANLPKVIKTDVSIPLVSLETVGSAAVAQWSNGTVLAIASRSPADQLTLQEGTVSIQGSLTEGASGEVMIAPAASREEALRKIQGLRSSGDLESAAAQHWNQWMNAGRLPGVKGADAEAYLEAYKRNLYCVKSANLNGQIPADITGQFVTNGMPQLYPRDAMMCARVLLLSGHSDEARQIIEFWGRPDIPMKSPGEWYARYDAHGKAVDGGSGARYDEPEWDSNGYYIYLLNAFHRAKGVWLAPAKMVYLLADFLVSHLSPNGLLYDGGIVEWTGYLPATNMIDAAALKIASDIARQQGENTKAESYTAAAAKISAAMPYMFDDGRQTYGDVRFTAVKGPNGESLPEQSGKKLYLWDTTANVGVIWGYPDRRELDLSNDFYDANTVKLGGGMQYFDSPDPGLAGYGHGVFFFTTAAAAEYESLRGRKAKAKGFIDWMLKNANVYGLMPEHISPDGSEVSPASPLSWCCAEFAAALLLWSQG